jgi:hypothetical protein
LRHGGRGGEESGTRTEVAEGKARHGLMLLNVVVEIRVPLNEILAKAVPRITMPGFQPVDDRVTVAVLVTV